MTQIIYIDGGGPLEVEFLGVTPIFSQSVGGVTGISFGAATASRKIIVAVHAISNDGFDTQVTGGSIGGVPATVFVGDCYTPGGGTRGDLGMWWMGANVPSGASGTISMTLANGGGSAFFAVWRMVNALDLTPTDTAATPFYSTSAPSVSVNADALAGGVYFAAATAYRFGSFTLSGVTPDYYAPIVPGADVKIMGGFSLIPSDVIGHVATLTPDAANEIMGSLAAATFR